MCIIICLTRQPIDGNIIISSNERRSTPISLESVKTIFEIAYYIVAICAAIAAVIVYYQNRKLEQSRWASMFYEKFYEGKKYTGMRVLLDSSDVHAIDKLVDEEPVEFNDYLNFFEHIAIFAESKQLASEDVEASFAYYLDCLDRVSRVRDYIDNEEKGYEKLSAYLKTRKRAR